MPLFGKSKKRKPQSRSRKALSSSAIFNFTGFSSPQPHSTPSHQSPQLVQSQTSTWHAPPFSYPQYLGSHTQLARQQYPPSAAHTSSPHLPRKAPHSSPPPGQMHGQHTKWTSCQNLPDTLARPCQVVNTTVNRTTDYLNRGAALCDQVANKLNDVISLMDEETFGGNEQDLRLTYYQSPPSTIPRTDAQPVSGGRLDKAVDPTRGRAANRSNECHITQKVLTTNNVFAKPAAYANSRLPADLPSLRVYIPTWPLLCLAAQYSLNAYRKPLGAEKDAYVDADWRVGTKAMVIKSVPIDDMNTVVFAIRGTQTFMDWAVNLNTSTVSPSGFLDDPGNLCHAGFLDVARKMIKPVASRLRQMLEENPSRAACSLVITGHSAGGAVASLLFSHMLCRTAKSELNILTGCFKRVHCVTFGAPPVSLLPLFKPAAQERKLRKHLFLSFINEGDPVTRADKAYVRSLLELYRTPLPEPISGASVTPNQAVLPTSKANLISGLWNAKSNKGPMLPTRHATAPATTDGPVSNMVWKVPSATLSNAGRLVLLRIPLNGRNEDVNARIITDEQLRWVIFGDPMMHQMKLYSRRIEILATKAATGQLMS